MTDILHDVAGMEFYSLDPILGSVSGRVSGNCGAVNTVTRYVATINSLSATSKERKVIFFKSKDHLHLNVHRQSFVSFNLICTRLPLPSAFFAYSVL